MQPKVSVIVPFYNAEKNIKKCISSILQQTYENIELILVNNLSTDLSCDIAQKTISNYSSCILINCNEQGVSFARNAGMDCATGEFILFIDADDYLEEDAISRLMENKDYASVAMSYCIEDENGSMTRHLCEKTNKIVFSKHDFIMDLFIGSVGHYQGFLWNKILKRNVIVKNNLRFRTDIAYNEDRLFLFRYFSALNDTDKILYLPYEGYHYINNSGGAMNNLHNKPPHIIITEIKAFEEMIHLCIYKDIKKEIINQSIRSCIIILKKYNIPLNSEEYRYLISFMKKNRPSSFKYYCLKHVFLHKSLSAIYKKIK